MSASLKKNPLDHVAIIMDGNGRCGSGAFSPRIWGHIRGVKTVS